MDDPDIVATSLLKFIEGIQRQRLIPIYFEDGSYNVAHSNNIVPLAAFHSWAHEPDEPMSAGTVKLVTCRLLAVDMADVTMGVDLFTRSRNRMELLAQTHKWP